MKQMHFFVIHSWFRLKTHLIIYFLLPLVLVLFVSTGCLLNLQYCNYAIILNTAASTPISHIGLLLYFPIRSAEQSLIRFQLKWCCCLVKSVHIWYTCGSSLLCPRSSSLMIQKRSHELNGKHPLSAPGILFCCEPWPLTSSHILGVGEHFFKVSNNK